MWDGGGEGGREKAGDEGIEEGRRERVGGTAERKEGEREGGRDRGREDRGREKESGRDRRRGNESTRDGKEGEEIEGGKNAEVKGRKRMERE